MIKITKFGHIYVSIFQGIGQARWSIPKGVACIRIPHLVNVEVGSTPSNVSQEQGQPPDLVITPLHKMCTFRAIILLLDWWTFCITIVASVFLRPCHHYLGPLGCWFYLVESGGQPPQNLNWIKQMTGPHLPGCLGCWVLVIWNNLREQGVVISIAKRVGHALSVPDSEGSHLLPEDLGSGEPVSGLRPK